MLNPICFVRLFPGTLNSEYRVRYDGYFMFKTKTKIIYSDMFWASEGYVKVRENSSPVYYDSW